MRKPGMLILVLLASATPVAAQDYDPSMAAHEATSQQQFTTQQSAIGAGMIQESVRRNNGRKAFGGSMRKNRQTCANARRMARHSDDWRLPKLLALCRKRGY